MHYDSLHHASYLTLRPRPEIPVNTLMKALLTTLEQCVDQHIDKLPDGGWRIKDDALPIYKRIVKSHGDAIDSRGFLGETALHQALIFMDASPICYHAISRMFIVRFCAPENFKLNNNTEYRPDWIFRLCTSLCHHASIHPFE